MAENANESLNTLIQRQNELFQQQNRLLEQFIEQKKFSELLLPGEKIFIDNLFRDEIRNNYLVTSRRKRIWNIQLNLLDELNRICKKHNIRYFAYFGTLLGAARHKGFIPWDDDVDVIMFRPDFEKFKALVKAEVNEAYFVDGWYDYKLEEEEPEILNDKTFLQVVKRNQRKAHPLWWPFWPMIKLKDSRTAFIQYLDRPHVHQGIFIDIFPFDPVPPFADEQQKVSYEAEREMLISIVQPDVIKKALAENQALLLAQNDMKKFLALPHHKKAMTLEAFALKSFSKSEFVGQLCDHILTGRKHSYAGISYPAKNFEKIIWLPFEKTEVPCPVCYEDCLNELYHDWRKPVVLNPHVRTFSVDFPYTHFFSEINRK